MRARRVLLIKIQATPDESEKSLIDKKYRQLLMKARRVLLIKIQPK
jgi:hypothetical protein